jgi:hypothetical protein
MNTDLQIPLSRTLLSDKLLYYRRSESQPYASYILYDVTCTVYRYGYDLVRPADLATWHIIHRQVGFTRPSFC